MIKNKLLLVALIAASLLLPAAVRAIGIEIQVGDRPFYSHGPRYWADDYEMVWVSGHWNRHHEWIHGRYIRSEHRQHNFNGRRFDHDHHDDHRDSDRG